MKDNISGMSVLEMGISKGWAGVGNTIMMTANFGSKHDFDVYIQYPYHTEYLIQTAFDYLDRSTFVLVQFEA